MDRDTNCEFAGCTSADLLPARCRACNKQFCSQHLSYDGHQCPKRPQANALPVCPLCNQAVPLASPTQSPDMAVSMHIDGGCKPVPTASQQAAGVAGGLTTGGAAATSRMNFCSMPGCNKNEITLIQCHHCRNSYCVTHRAATAHKCRVAEQRDQARRTPPPEAAPGISPTTKVTSLVEMRLRNTAKTAYGVGSGDHTPDHLVLRVFFNPLEHRANPFYMHVNPRYIAGRLLDAACTQGDVRNPNATERDDAKRLWLHNVRTGMAIAPGLVLGECCQSNDVVLVSLGTTLPAKLQGEGDMLRAALLT